MNDRSTLLLEHHLKELKLPSFLREYGKMAAQCAAGNVDRPEYLLRLAELEIIDLHQRMVERRIRAARFPAVKSLDTFDFPAIPSANRGLVTEMARCEYVQRRENVIAAGNVDCGENSSGFSLENTPTCLVRLGYICPLGEDRMVMMDHVSDAIRCEVWGMLCDLERSCRYYSTVAFHRVFPLAAFVAVCGRVWLPDCPRVREMNPCGFPGSPASRESGVDGVVAGLLG